MAQKIGITKRIAVLPGRSEIEIVMKNEAKFKRKPLREPSSIDTHVPKPVYYAPLQIQLYDASTTHYRIARSSFPNDVASTFTAYRQETSIFNSSTELSILATRLATNLQTPDPPQTIVGSERPLAGNCWPLQATPELTGYALTLRARSKEPIEGDYINPVLAVLSPYRNGHQILDISGNPDGGSFKLKYNNSLTPAIAYNAEAETIKTAIESVFSGIVGVSGGPLGVARVEITLSGAGNEAFPLIPTDISLAGGDNPTIQFSCYDAGVPGIGSMRNPEQLKYNYQSLRGFIPEENLAEYDADGERINRISQELFTPEILPEVQRDLYLTLNSSPNSYNLAIDCPYHYYFWSMFDKVNYLVTDVPYFGGTEVDPYFINGVGKIRKLDVYLTPQRHLYRYAYYAVYLQGTLWWSTITWSPNNGTFYDRLPWHPYPYQFTEVGLSGVNDEAMSRWISGSRAYATSLAQDHGFEYFTPWSFQILIGRVEGRWSVRQGRIAAKQLCAVIDAHNSDGSKERYYIWTRTANSRPLTAFDYGPLFTADIVPFSLEGPQYNFSQGIDINIPL